MAGEAGYVRVLMGGGFDMTFKAGAPAERVTNAFDWAQVLSKQRTPDGESVFELSAAPVAGATSQQTITANEMHRQMASLHPQPKPDGAASPAEPAPQQAGLRAKPGP